MKPRSHASSESAKVCNSGFGAQLPCPQKRKGIGLDPRKKVNLSNPQHDLTTVIYLLYFNTLLFYVILCYSVGLGAWKDWVGAVLVQRLSDFWVSPRLLAAINSEIKPQYATISYCTDLYNVSMIQTPVMCWCSVPSVPLLSWNHPFDRSAGISSITTSGCKKGSTDVLQVALECAGMQSSHSCLKFWEINLQEQSRTNGLHIAWKSYLVSAIQHLAASVRNHVGTSTDGEQWTWTEQSLNRPLQNGHRGCCLGANMSWHVETSKIKTLAAMYVGIESNDARKYCMWKSWKCCSPARFLVLNVAQTHLAPSACLH